MSLVDNTAITRAEIYKGTSIICYGELASFPGELESIINPTTYVLAAGLTRLVPTTEDGVTIKRTAELSDGIPIDQKPYNLDEGEPTAWTMEGTTTLLNSDVDVIQIVWQTPAPDAVSGSVVEQKRLALGAPETFTERQLYIIQEDFKTLRMRAFAFRKSVPQTDSEMNIQSEEASGVPITWKFRADTDIAEHHGPFGFIFEEDPA